MTDPITNFINWGLHQGWPQWLPFFLVPIIILFVICVLVLVIRNSCLWIAYLRQQRRIRGKS